MIVTRIRSAMFTLLTVLICLPVIALIGAWVEWNDVSAEVLRDLFQTVLPEYAATSFFLSIGVALGVGFLGTTTATAVSLFKFPGRSFFEWGLLLPMAIPAYVVAYSYTDFLQYSGPLQNFIRQNFGMDGRVLPEVRSLGGAVLVFSLALYPYVYLLVKTSLSDSASSLMEAARMLGVPLRRRIVKVALPLARPAMAAGIALALMETLADFGVSSYFGIQTFTTGIYKSWLILDNRVAASQLASLLLVVVLALLFVEKNAQSKMRFSTQRSGHEQGRHTRLNTLSFGTSWLLTVWCALPIALGFMVPIALMINPLLASEIAIDWTRFIEWTLNSLQLSATTAVIAVSIALVLIFNLRMFKDWVSQLATTLIGLGYALPGAVVVVGLLIPIAWTQKKWPDTPIGYWMTASVIGLIWAYLVRFCAVAIQTIQSGYARIPKSLDDSSRILGISGLHLLTSVHKPMLKRSILAALLLVFVDVMKELPVTLVLRPFNSDTLAVMAYQLARDERLGEAALPSLALVLAGLIPVIVLSRAISNKGEPVHA
jgi:iron(III) transport system permease protein